MKVTEGFHPTFAFGVLRSDLANVLICSLTTALILTVCWILVPFRYKSQVLQLGTAGERNTDVPLPRVYLNDSNWLSRFLDPLAAFARGSELLKKGYKMVIRKLASN
jgi:hypothetical protein